MEPAEHGSASAAAADADALLRHAAALHADGQAEQAAKAYRHLLALVPDMAEAAVGLAAILRAKGDPGSAAALLRRATGRHPGHAGAWHAYGLLLAEGGQHAEAVRAFGHVLGLDSGHAEALLRRAEAHVALGASEPALADLAGAARLMPGDGSAHRWRGVLLQRLGRMDEAVAAYQASLAIDPDQAAVLSNIGSILRLAGRYEEALPYYREAIAADPALVAPRAGIADALLRLNRPAEAAGELFAALDRDPGADGLHNSLGTALYGMVRQGEAGAAQAAAQRWLARHPDNPIARHTGQVIAGSGMPARASDAYLRHVFDRFADAFDDKLAHLGYRAPQAILDAAVPHLGGQGELAILDAGCGTGLAARLLRPLAAELVGIDLSAGMLEKARERGLYDRLEEAEITAWLAAHPDRYDLIFAADVLIYFGDLGAVTAAAARALRPGGLLAFTVERLDGEGEVAIGPHGRYAHAPSHLRRAIAAAGLDILLLRSEPLRQEMRQPVLGWLAVARRAGGAAPPAGPEAGAAPDPLC